MEPSVPSREGCAEYFRSLGGKSHLKYAVNVRYMPREPPLNLLRLYITKENRIWLKVPDQNFNPSAWFLFMKTALKGS